MKLCEECGKQAAAVFLKLAVNNKVTEAHLCPACAAKKGLAFGPEAGTFNISDIVGNMDGYLKDFLPREPRTLTCRACGLKYSIFKETGRLGCPECYKNFEPQLNELMLRIHGSAQHTGRGCPCGIGHKLTKAAAARRAVKLKSAISAAVAKEDFELAAYLRDSLRQLEARNG